MRKRAQTRVQGWLLNGVKSLGLLRTFRFLFPSSHSRADGIRARRSAVYGPVPHVDACLLPH